MPKLFFSKTRRFMLLACRLIFYFLFIAIVLFAAPAHGATLVVPDESVTIQTAINTAMVGDTVLVKSGTYAENINFLGKAITVRSISGAENTIIDAGGNGNGVMFESGEQLDSVLDGFTIINARGLNNHGIKCYQGSATITNNIIKDNENAGIVLYKSNSIVRNNVIYGNQGGFAAIHSAESSPIIEGNKILATGRDALHIGDSEGALAQSFRINSNIITGSIFISVWSAAAAFESEISNNIMKGGLNINLQDSAKLLIVNNTIHQGTISLQRGGNNTEIINNMIIGPESGIESQSGYSEILNNNLWNNEQNYIGIPDQTGINGNISIAPAFVNPVEGDYHLKDDSPCIGAGTLMGAPAADIEGNPRPNPPGSHPDMGAYENSRDLPFDPQGLGPVITAPIKAGFGEAGTTVIYNLWLTNDTGATDSFLLYISGNAWPTSLSLHNTGILPDGWLVPFTVSVEVPASAFLGDPDTVTVTATSVSDPETTDTVTLPTSVIVIEDFSSEPVPFSDVPEFSVSNGRLFFHGDRSDGASGVVWAGGSNPGGETPLRKNSNYLENFKVSVDTNWEGGAENYPYGLAVCTYENSSGTMDNIQFAIDKNGSYLIGKRQDGEWETIRGWQRSSLIATDGQNNHLSIKKVGPYFHFYINEVEVARRIIVGYHGGGVGVLGNHQVDASFDNFAVTKLSANHIETDSNDVFEDFSAGSGGFSESVYASALSGRFVFRGDRSDYTYFHAWVGGFNPGGWDAQPDNSNYFENFAVSVDTYWEGGAEDYVYGLKACIRENSLGTADSVRFYITGDGWYTITKKESGVFERLVDWTESGLILTGGQKNNLSIQKNGSQFHFYINNARVQQLTISGLAGGSVGVEASQYVDVSFDNFSITIPGTPPTADAGADRKVNERDTVTLNGSNSFDPDDGIYSYQWYQIAGPPVTLSDSTIVQPTFTAPDVGLDGTSLAFQLAVTDYSRLHSTDICVATIRNRKAMPWIPLLLLDDQ